MNKLKIRFMLIVLVYIYYQSMGKRQDIEKLVEELEIELDSV